MDPVNPSQPTILVKKADGTEVRMTMAEFRAYREKKQESKKAIREEAPVIAPAKSGESVMSKPATPFVTPQVAKPVMAVPKPMEKAPEPPVNLPIARVPTVTPSAEPKKTVQWSNDDHVSPLEEPSLRPVTSVVKPLAVLRPEDRVGEALQRVSFFVKDTMRGRLQSLLISRVKGIRTNEQVMEYLVRGEANGGVGLTQEEAMEALALVNAGLPRDRDHVRKMKTEPVEKKMVAAPVSSQKTEKMTVSVHAPLPIGDEPISLIRERSFSSPQKVAVRDVVPPPQKTMSRPEPSSPMGPLDEFRHFSLVDVRRLGTGTASLKALEAKFDTMKQESYVAWLDAREAFFGSPLFAAYRDCMLTSIRDNQPITMVVGKGGQMTFEEWQTVATLTAYLDG